MNVANSATAGSVLSLQDLSHSYGDRSVLQGFSLELKAGETVGLLGPNGSGKSTVIGLLAGLIQSQTGRFAVAGQPVAQGAAPLRERLGVVFQSPSLDVRLSVLENLSLAAAMRGLLGAAGRERVEAMLRAVRLTERQHDVVGKLSGGMRRRIDIARALLHQPAILVLDEPSAGLDERSFRELWASLEELRSSSGLAILLATHRPDEAEHCTRLLVLADGKTLAELTPDAMRARVAGDLVVLKVRDAAEAEASLRPVLDGELRINGDEVWVRAPAGTGPALIPRLFQLLPAPPLEVALRQPSLADAFLAVTGQSLEAA